MSETIVTPLDVANATPTKTFTQDEVNELLAQNKRSLREKYADYEHIKAKAARFDAGTTTTELEAAQQRADQAEANLKALLDQHMREDIAKAANVPVDMLEGNNETELKAHAETLRVFMDNRATPAPDPSQGRNHSPIQEPYRDGLERGLHKALNISPI